jgi:hypothetical protein
MGRNAREVRSEVPGGRRVPGPGSGINKGTLGNWVKTDRRWYGDGTEIAIAVGKLYLDSVLDMGSH